MRNAKQERITVLGVVGRRQRALDVDVFTYFQKILPTIPLLGCRIDRDAWLLRAIQAHIAPQQP